MPVSSSLRMLQHLVLPSSLFDTHSHTHTHTRSHAFCHGYILIQLSVTHVFTNLLHWSPSQGPATLLLTLWMTWLWAPQLLRRKPLGLHFCSFPQLLPRGWSTTSIRLPLSTCPHPPGPVLFWGPASAQARVSHLGCFRRSCLSAVPSHTSPRAQKHTQTCGQDVLHRFRPCKEICISYRKGPNFQIFNILE